MLHYGYGFNLENRSRSIFMRGIENLGHKPVTVYKWDATKVVNFILNVSDMSLKFMTQIMLCFIVGACSRRINNTLASVRTPNFFFGIQSRWPSLIYSLCPGLSVLKR